MAVKSYTFQVVLEPDGEGWHVFFPDWEEIGASTWGYTQTEALEYIREVLEMIIEEFEEEGTPLPPTGKMAITEGESVTVTV